MPWWLESSSFRVGFLKDQRSERKLFIDRLDEENTTKQQLRALHEEVKRQPPTSGFKISAEKNTK